MKLYPVTLVSAPSITDYDSQVYFVHKEDAEEYGQPLAYSHKDVDLEVLMEDLEDGEQVVIRRENWTKQQLDDVYWED